MQDYQSIVRSIGERAKVASRLLAVATVEQKNAALLAIADQFKAHTPAILEANRGDLEDAQRNRLTSAMQDRLKLSESRIEAMANGVRKVAALQDPVGEVMKSWTQPNGLVISKKRVPIGVIGIIYESRPNVTSDAAVLCLKAGNATILRGGSEALRSNLAIANVLRAGLAAAGLPSDSVIVVDITDREIVKELARCSDYLDLIIPRGGRGLIEAVVSNARMPVIKHYDGICHVYVDQKADFGMAESIIINAKCQKPSVCNAMETLLVHHGIAREFLPKMAGKLRDNGVELRGDARTCEIVGSLAKSATEEDFRTEYLDLILSVAVVDTLDAGIGHIEKYGSHHSDVIVTSDAGAAEEFLNRVDSATVYWNASTRFTDGEEFGFGAEIGISTDKLHARGPMALEELTSYKYIICGQGQIRN